jgi:hypothetical protein
MNNRKKPMRTSQTFIKMFGPNCELHRDLGNQAAQGLAPLLGPYQKNRPIKEVTK